MLQVISGPKLNTKISSGGILKNVVNHQEINSNLLGITTAFLLNLHKHEQLNAALVMINDGFW